MAGISNWHGPHQVAQKLMSTTCPFSEESCTGWPARSFSLKSGAGAPATGAGAGVSTGPLVAAAVARCPSNEGTHCAGSPTNITSPASRPTSSPAPTISTPARPELAALSSIILTARVRQPLPEGDDILVDGYLEL